MDSEMPISIDVASAAHKTDPKNATTRADLKGITDKGPWETGDQFVVNAYYYNSSTTTLGQQFFYDQKVTAAVSTDSWNNSSSTSWSYDPVKYWPQQGYVDYFAAYPKDYVDHNMDRQRLYHENLGDTVISTRFYLDKPKAQLASLDQLASSGKLAPLDPLAQSGLLVVPADQLPQYSDATEQWDLMFSHRPHLSKPDVTTPVRFHFSHAEMAVRFFVKTLDAENIGGLVIKQISLNNIHSGGKITAFDITNWQQYYAEFPGSPGVEVSTAGAKTPVRLDYVWDWTGLDPLAPDVRDTYTQTMDFVWYNGQTKPEGTQINPRDKVFIIPPQCLGESSGSSITVDYIITDLGDKQTYHTSTFNVDICGEPGKVVNIFISLTHHADTHIYQIEPITATLIPWEDVTASLSTDLEQ